MGQPASPLLACLGMDSPDHEDQTPLSQEERDKTVTMYEKFINERLKVDMDLILTERDKVFEELTS
jgi:hypothetical protein